MEGFEYIIKVNTSEGKRFKDLNCKRKVRRKCSLLKSYKLSGITQKKIFYNYIEDDMKCKVYTFYSINFFLKCFLKLKKKE